MLTKRYIDISHAIQPKLLSLLESLCKLIPGNELVNLNEEVLRSTHLYSPGGELTGVYPGRFLSKGWLFNLEGTEPGEVLTCDCLGDTDDLVMPGDSVIFSTGWSNKRESTELYIDKCPTIGFDLVEWFIRKHINAVVIDSPFLANSGYMAEFVEVYEKLAKSNILVVCSATNLGVLNQPAVQLVMMPLKIVGGNLAPVRAMVYDV